MNMDQPTLTFLLSRWSAGDCQAGEEVMEKAYGPLRELARRIFASERPDQTLQPTALVHEVYIAMARRGEIKNQKHFFGLAACMMRAFLADQGRRRGSLKRGGDRQRVTLTPGIDDAIGPTPPPEDLLALSQALERLAVVDPQKAAIVEQRYFGDLTTSEIASNLGVTERTIRREWRRAKAWLYTALEPEHRDVL